MMITNLFMPPEQKAGLIAQGRMERFCFQACEVFLKNNTDFDELFFSANGQTELKAALPAVRKELRKVRVVDLVGRASQMQAISQIMAENGFSQYAIFQRMVRASGVAAIPIAGFLCDVQAAGAGDVRVVWELLHDQFDKFSEHLPDIGNVVETIRKGGVLLAKQKQKIMGLLVFSQTGYTALLRYWWVDSAFRGIRVGASLMAAYQARCPDAKRFILWVDCKNNEAIARYRHLGYEQDGMTDIIMIARDHNGRVSENIDRDPPGV
jgi:ribosomal protein S18 acetylase RimI-like enzyme